MYEDKLVLMQSDDKTYEQLSKDLTLKYERKLDGILNRLKTDIK